MVMLTLVIGGVFTLQLLWLYRIYDSNEKEFNLSVIKSIRGVYEDLELTTYPVRLNTLIEQPNSNSFIFRIDSLPHIDSLKNDLSENLEGFGVFTDCHFYVYDPVNASIIYQGYIQGAAGKQSKDSLFKKLLIREYPYVMLYFPDKAAYVLSTLKWWVISSAVLLILLIALSFSIFFLYRQKFLNEIQNDFLRNITHEFQTPLTTLLVGMDAIGRNSNDPRTEKYIQLMQNQVSYLRQHIDNLIRVVRSEGEGFIAGKDNVNMNELIHSAIDQLSSSIEEKKAEVDLHLEPSLSLIKADPGHLLTVMINLLSNALKFSPHPKIRICSKTVENGIEISVEDNGIGIDQAFQKKLFRKFFRVPTGDVHNTKGLGLGLYLAKRIIQAHHGNIAVKSQPGKGTLFIIMLPKN